MEGPVSDLHRGLTTRELASAITELAGHLNAANRRWLGLIAEFDRRKGWSDSATQSCAHWLNWQRGELSYSKVHALTRVATEATERYLLAIALHGTAHHVETLVRQYRRVQEAEELSWEERQQARRSVSYYFDDDDGSLVIKARLPAETGMLLRAREAALPEVPLPRGDCEVPLHVSAETSGMQFPTLQRGSSMPAETARRLACDCSVVTIVEDEYGQPLDVGRKTRSIPPALRGALSSRDRGA